MLAYWEPYHIQSFAISRIMGYLGPEAHSESCLYKHIQAYLVIFDSDSYNNIDFLFFHFSLNYFPTKFKKTGFFDYNDVIFNARLSLLK